MEKEQLKSQIENKINSNKLMEAVELMFQYEKLYKPDDESYNYRAIVNYFTEDYFEAIKNIQNGIALNCFNANLYFNLGMVYKALNLYDLSYICYKHAEYNTSDKVLKDAIKVDIQDLKLKAKVANTSIVIVTYNNLEYNKLCIRSIKEYCDMTSLEVIVVDNNSTDGTAQWLDKEPGIKVVKSKVNLGFIEGTNKGIEVANKNNDILLLNNDTVIMPNSIFNLKMALYSDNSIGAVGPITNNASYTQNIDLKYDDFKDYIEFAMKNNVHDFNKYEERLKLVGFCMLVSRRVIDEVGVLDELFSPGNFDDDDFSLRIVKGGYKLILARDSYVHHFGSLSFGKDMNKLREIIKINSDKFYEKWGFRAEYVLHVRLDVISEIKKKRDDKIKVLEVGCASGASLLKIKDIYPHAELYGVELNEGCCEIAKNFCNIYNFNLETEEIPFEKEFFDVIILADVLEHLVDPWEGLKKLKEYLKNDGQVLVSLPNVMHISVVNDLLSGKWTYEDAGILDRTHLRFFTLHEIKKMFNDLNFNINSISYTNVFIDEESQRKLDLLSKLYNVDKMQFSAYQYIVSADKSKVELKKNESIMNEDSCEKSQCIDENKLVDNFLNEQTTNNNFVGEGTVHIHPSVEIVGGPKIRIGPNVQIMKDSWLNIPAFNNEEFMLEIQEGAVIGRRATISAANKIIIGKNVLLGPNVLISDHNHQYRNIEIPIKDQWIDSESNTVYIGEGTWIGTNSVIVGNVSVGKNCVIGANSVVNRSFPDYCIIAGNPAKIVKAFDINTGKWIKVKDEEVFRKELEEREKLIKYMLPINNLTSMQVEVSSICNLKCPQCFNNIEGHKSEIMKVNLWEEKIRPVLKYLKSIHLVGIGEPLLCKELFNYIEECRQYNMEINTTSNLQLVNDEIAKNIVLSGITNLSFSCDGVSEETYNSIRVNGTYEKLVESIELINKYKKLHKTDYPRLILNFGAMEKNIRELPQVVRNSHEWGVDKIIAYHDIIYVKGLEKESLFYNKELSDSIFMEAKELSDSLGIEMFYPGTFNNSIKREVKEGTKYCPYPYIHLWIYSDGRVGPCCMDFPNRIILGDLKNSTIEEVWNSKEVLKLRESMDSVQCETCKYCAMHGKMDINDKNYLIKV